MKQSFHLLLHITFWLGYLFLVGIIMFAALQGREIPPQDYAYYASFILGVGIIPPVLSFYGHYLYLFSAYLQKRKIFQTIIFSLLLSIFSIGIGFSTIYLGSKEAFGCVTFGFRYAGSFTLLLCTIFGVIALMLRGFLTWYEELKLKEELLEKTHKMEMALIKSQLDPHFLFNTLNNIDVLIEKDPTQASTYLKKLSDIMRFMLYHTKGEEIPLTRELDYIDKYIELQKIRTANPDYVSYNLQGDPTGRKVAPMVFIPFIENAFKHATNKKVDHAVDIDIHIKSEFILFTCQNVFDPDKIPSAGEHGLGNDLIEKRLSLLYPEHHTLKVHKTYDLYLVELSIHHEKAYLHHN
ncbi:MAG: sensor histidine kinase [Bacteroidota bacterium]